MPHMSSRQYGGVKVLDKAMHILDVVEYKQPLAFQELVEIVGLPNTTAHRLVAALDAHGFLRRDGAGRLIAGSRFATDTLTQIARPILVALTRETGESSQLYVRRGQQRLCVLSIDSPAELRTAVPEGALLPLDKGSGGHVLRSDPETLRRGWAESAGQRAPGVASVSAPVLGNSGVVAAVTVSGPIARLGGNPGARFAKQVMAAAREIEQQIAGSHS